MSTFDDRKNAFENKFAHDAELKFRIEARRNKLLGHWAAEIMGVEADDYAKQVIDADFKEAGDEDVFQKIRTDFDAKKVAMSDDDIRNKMIWLLDVATEQLVNE